MKFRRLYWVTEQLDNEGQSEICGVFTSIPDLVEEGLRWNDEIDKTSCFRISLVKLDSKHKPLGMWQSPDYKNLGDDLQEYVQTQEFSTPECESLLDGLKEFSI